MDISFNKLINWSKSYPHWLVASQWLSWSLVTLLLAKVFWLLVMYATSADVSQQKAQLHAIQNSVSNNASVNVSSLVSRHLFGRADQPIVKTDEIIAKKETRLNLTLRGVYAANDPARSNAIIEDGKKKQVVYFINEALKVPGRVFLKQVLADRVIIETNGVNEILRLKGVLPIQGKKRSKKSIRGQSKQTSIKDKRKDKQISRSLSRYREQLMHNPLSLTKVVKYQPKFVDGSMVGIVVSPGNDKRLFSQLGLKRQDVITAVNGTPLTNTKNAMQLLSTFKDTQEFEVEVKRGDERFNLLLNLNQNLGR